MPVSVVSWPTPEFGSRGSPAAWGLLVLGVAGLLHIDQRIRRERFGMELGAR
ncbi:MAG: hypothetical protein L0I24_02930 [Pseudonocardia sp.]|nr:hypothetical protein [Pseudonocardia sp.]